MSTPRAVVLVEGESDRLALGALARRLGRDLVADDVALVAMGGITNLRAFATRYGPLGADVPLAGLYDIGEERHVRRGLVAAGLPAAAAPDGPVRLGFHACDIDLEDELMRPLGLDGVEAVIEEAGEGRSLRLLTRMPAQAGWTRQEVLRRFLGSQSGRKARYAQLFVEAMDPDRLPGPLRSVLAEV
ncbi:TOPRIM nucleotidyl transferase/hydrolase domain-containing protein [Janibacter sp. GS2]|uniref:TOPRIM nucleotidyl transferase/hydrolase domain-containing protein n=1 Tax=Janibacter sp. GS2 TaxID=3442646 RepID=UPI003EC0ABC2